MQFANIIFLGASFIGIALAQSGIAFTTLPSAVTAGEPTTLRWAGGQANEPVTILLKNGPSTNLQYVATLTGKATGGSFTWIPSKSLPNGEYALQISQGVDDVNYSGMFTLSGGSTAATTTALPISESSSSSSSSASTTVTLLTPLPSLGSNTTALTNSTIATTTVPLGTGVAVIGTGATVIGTGASAAGTGTALHRNTTLSKPTLSSTKTKSSSSTGPASTGAGTTTAAGSTGSSTDAPRSAAMRLGSPVALILSVFAAVVYLG